MFVKGETLLMRQIEEVGKLTAPSKTRSFLQQKTMMDEMRNSLHVPTQNGSPENQIVTDDQATVP